MVKNVFSYMYLPYASISLNVSSNIGQRVIPI